MSKYLKVIGIIEIISSIILVISFLISLIITKGFSGPALSVILNILILAFLIFVAPALGILFIVVSSILETPMTHRKRTTIRYKQPSIPAQQPTKQNFLRPKLLNVDKFYTDNGEIIINVDNNNIFLKNNFYIMLQIFKNRVSYIDYSNPQEINVLIFKTEEDAQKIYNQMMK